MKIELEAKHFDTFFDEMEGLAAAVPVSQSREESRIILPEHIGQGCVRRIRLRSGMELGFCRMQLHEPVAMDVGIRYPHMELAFTIQGKGYWCEPGRPGGQQLNGGTGSLIYMNDTVFHAEQAGGEPIDHMELRMDYMLWRHLLTGLPWRLKDRFYCRQDLISSKVLSVIQEMRDCPYAGPIKRLFLEGKSFELLAIILNEAGGEEPAGTPLSLKKADINALHAAKDILSHSWREPPGLLQLARMAGINDFKLKSGFKELFGTTVFGYVRRQRMEQARQLLEHGSVNVTEAAYQVGYSNISHFSTQFRKTFGYHPRETVRRGSGLD